MSTPHDDDPLREIAQTLAARERAQQAALRVSEARALMVSCKVPGVAKPALVFYVTLLLRLEPVATRTLTQTCATDGEKLWFNPEFVLGLGKEELFGVLAHETLHPALGHQARRQGRIDEDWQVAADLAINPILRGAGFRLPKGGLLPGVGQYSFVPNTGLSAEEIYDLLQQQKQPEPPPQGQPAAGDEEGDVEGDGAPDEGEGDAEPQPQQGSADPGGCGSVVDAGDGSPADARESESTWQMAVAQAADVARQMGPLGAGMDRFVSEVLVPKVDWREVLREFVSKRARTDHCWSRPNRRYYPQLYLPSLHSDELGDVVVAVDTSGSICEKELSLFGSELGSILECFHCTLTIVYHDVQVQHVQTWQPTDGPLRLEPKGGGGTSHIPVFEWIREHDSGEAPCVVCFTDLCTEFPKRVPDLPVLWAAVGDCHKSVAVPFGQVVEID